MQRALAAAQAAAAAAQAALAEQKVQSATTPETAAPGAWNPLLDVPQHNIEQAEGRSADAERHPCMTRSLGC